MLCNQFSQIIHYHCTSGFTLTGKTLHLVKTMTIWVIHIPIELVQFQWIIYVPVRMKGCKQKKEKEARLKRLCIKKDFLLFNVLRR